MELPQKTEMKIYIVYRAPCIIKCTYIVWGVVKWYHYDFLTEIVTNFNKMLRPIRTGDNSWIE